MRKIQLAPDLALADNAVTQTFGFIARKGGGKTYAAGKLVEELTRIGAPVVILDPVGNWYGLRLAADGKKPGLSIPVFGGEHGDVAIHAAQGERLAKIIIERNMSAVIDVSAFRKNERKRFAADFGEALFHAAKKNRSPRMVVFEEAQVFMPQNPGPDDRKMLGAFEDIVRLGRNFGLGSTLISQRPQSVNKEVLNQVEALFVGQLSGPQERTAIERWCKERDSDRSALEELPGLPVGTMVLWSPQWLSVFRKVKIGTKWTFDASATPVLGQKLEKAMSLAEVDVSALREALEDKKPAPKSTANGASLEQGKNVHLLVENTALRNERRALERSRHQLRAQLSDVLNRVQRVEASLETVTNKLKNLLDHPALWEQTPDKRPGMQAPEEIRGTPFENPSMPDARATRGKGDDTSLRAGAVRMLKMLATFYPGEMTKAQIARAAGMKVTSGTFSTYWSTLKREELIEEASSSHYRATPRGIDTLGHDKPSVPHTLDERIDFWNGRLKSGERALLREVISRRKLTREELADAVNMVPSSGTFSTYISTLTTNKLIKKTENRYVLHEWLTEGVAS